MCSSDLDDALDLDHGDRVDAGERLVQQDEARLRRQRPRDLDAAALAAGQRHCRRIAEVVEPERDMREATLDDLLAEFSISHLRRTPSLALSGGERRRVEIARALASRPQFMLLDEPLAGIDPIAVGEIRELIWHLRKRGIGVLITDHNVRETLDIVDRAYILHDGSVLMDGRPSEIVAHQDVRRVYLGERFSL